MKNPFERGKSTTPKPTQLSRRRFLGAAAALVGVSVDAKLSQHDLLSQASLSPNVPPSPRPNIPERQPNLDVYERSELSDPYRWQEDERRRQQDPRVWAEEESLLQQFGRQLDAFKQEYDTFFHLSSDQDSWGYKRYATLSEREQVIASRRLEETDLLTTLQALTDLMVIHGGRDLFIKSLQVFSLGARQGCAFQALKESGRRLHISIREYHDEAYYASRVRDHLPEVEDIYSHDIDARNQDDSFHLQEPEMMRHPGWTTRRKKTAFRELVADADVRQSAVDADMTIAEFFSCIKAMIHEIERIPLAQRTSRTRRTVMERILRAREDFLGASVIDQSTQQAIILYGNAVQHSDMMHFGRDPHHHRDEFNQQSWEYTLQAAGMSRSKIKTFGTTDAPHPRTARVRQQFFHAIATSRGKTFVATDSHGLAEELQIDDREPEAVIDYAGLADALIRRVEATQDPRTLLDLTLCIESCYSYDFTRNVVQAFSRQWQAISTRPFPFSGIKLPRIITTTQEQSPAHHREKLFGMLAQQARGISRDRAITGKRILQCAAPLAYVYNDFTFFQEGSGLEFAGCSDASGSGRQPA